MKFIFILYDPIREQLWLDLPWLIIFLHLENDAIAAIICNIDKEQDATRGIRLSEIEFS